MTAAAQTPHLRWRLFDPRVITDALSGESCEQLVNYFHDNRPRPRSYQGVVDRNLRQCSFVAVTDGRLASTVHCLTATVSHMYDAPAAIVPNQAPLIYRYDSGVGFVTHHDEVTPIEIQRAQSNGQPVVHGDVTVTISLSDPRSYDGGELYFIDPESEFKLPIGAAVTFPATRRVLHGVRPITTGHRFSLLVRFNIDY